MSSEKITISIDNKTFIIDKGNSLESIIKKYDDKKFRKYLGGRINNEIKHLKHYIEENSTIKLLDITDKDGIRIYTRTLSLIFIKACKDIFHNCKVTVEHSLSKGIYTEIHKDEKLTEEQVLRIKDRMIEIINNDYPITREVVTIDEARRIFTLQGMDDKLRLLKHTSKKCIHIYNMEGYYDTFYGYLASSTGYITRFDLKFYDPGVVIQFPRKEEKFEIPAFEEQKKLSKIYREAEQWGDILDLGYVGSLNDKIDNNKIGEVIRIAEALHEKKIAYIADKITEDENIKVILIAGPSSSGKTTFAERLSVQLKVNGKKPISISIDDYFVNREDTPLDENGEYDFESINAVDTNLFNKDILNLLEGKEVELPTFNFVLGKREYTGRKIKIDKDHPIIIEGIHGLNEKLTALIPHKNKFKIYISALTQLNVDSHNRIPTTDLRLLRRMVRDSKYRGNDAIRTLYLWESVRRGEEKNIFPYQEEADIMFNSALVYELAVIKKYVEPLLKEIGRDSEFYSESKRLLKFMSYFKDIIDEDVIPCTSILREFIGGSCFRDE